MQKHVLIKQVFTENQNVIFNVNIETHAKGMKFKLSGGEGNKNTVP